MNIHQWKTQIRKFNESFKDNQEVTEEWNSNTIANLPKFTKKNSIWNLEHKYYGKDEKGMILVGASPRLAEDVEKLKGVDDNFRIICANSSLKFLLQHGVKPHYVICLDADHIDIPQHLDCDNRGITLLASSVVSPKALDNWKGPIWFLPYYSVEIDKNIKRKVKSILGDGLVSGGNAMTAAFYTVTVIMGSKTVIFVGNEYCFDKKDYYADKKAARQGKIKTVYPVVDVKGRQRWTLPALYAYAIWMEKISEDLSPPGFFIDTSFGLLGKDTDKIHVMELSEAIKKVKEAFVIRDQLNESKKTKKEILQEILKEKKPENDQSEVFRYNMQEQREKLLHLARS